MAKKMYTAAERQAVKESRKQLTDAAKDIEQNRPEDIDRAIAILLGFSRGNIALILLQAEFQGRGIPQAVAGFHEWRKAGRVVRKGSKGYGIMVPMARKSADGESAEDQSMRFGFAHVFDVVDTDPISEDSPKTLRAAMEVSL
jgi:hypothetical protein